MRFTSYIAPYLLALLTFSTICITYTQLPSTKDELNIRNKLALYAYAVDDKDYGLLDQVFTADVEAIKTYISTSVTGLVTQHTLSSLLIEIVGGPANNSGANVIDIIHSPTDASHEHGVEPSEYGNGAGINSTTYLVANYFGQRELAGKLLVFYGTYYDAWTLDEPQFRDWKIKARTLRLF
ncbi:MAG: hypothetical protein Q9192_008765, partial [Flavoplaca navasiana]